MTVAVTGTYRRFREREDIGELRSSTATTSVCHGEDRLLCPPKDIQAQISRPTPISLSLLCQPYHGDTLCKNATSYFALLVAIAAHAQVFVISTVIAKQKKVPLQMSSGRREHLLAVT